MGAFLIPFMGSSLNVALPEIGREFAMSAISLSWVATSFLLTSAMCLVPFGRLADIYGRKRIFAYGVAVYTISSLLAAISTSAGFLIAARAVQGIGGAMIFGTGMAILTSVFPAHERGKALGVNVAAVYLGLSLGPPLGGLLTQHLGWRSIFLVNVPLGLTILLATARVLQGEWAEARGERFDWIGSAVYSLSLVALMYGFSRLPATLGVWLIAAGIAGLGGFILWETKVLSPILNVNLFRHNQVFALSNLAALINYSATFAVGFLLSLYLQYIKGFSPQNAGLILVAQPAVQAAFSPLAGRLSDRIEPRVVASMGMALTVIGLSFLSFLDADMTLALIVADLMLLGFGFALFSSPNTNAVMSSVDRRFYGIASGTLGTMRLIGQMLSMGIATLVFALYIGQVQITPEYHLRFLKSARLIFTIFAALCFGGIFASLGRGKVHETARPQRMPKK
ncbi:MAG: MFS transporter [Anaerolineae bacterium]|nr:MFS transporter [Anaerolineae bacterium]MDW8101144.1 MFS transporter [Anaerolineae bacterium]